MELSKKNKYSYFCGHCGDTISPQKPLPIRVVPQNNNQPNPEHHLLQLHSQNKQLQQKIEQLHRQNEELRVQEKQKGQERREESKVKEQKTSGIKRICGAIYRKGQSYQRLLPDRGQLLKTPKQQQPSRVNEKSPTSFIKTVHYQPVSADIQMSIYNFPVQLNQRHLTSTQNTTPCNNLSYIPAKEQSERLQVRAKREERRNYREGGKDKERKVVRKTNQPYLSMLRQDGVIVFEYLGWPVYY